MLFRSLETKRLDLKNLSEDDRDFLLTQFSNSDVSRYLFDAEPMSNLHDADKLIAFYTTPEPRQQHRWILVKKDDGEKIGTCGFHRWNREAAICEIGYDLRPQAWGKGYMSEALQALLAFARDEMKVRRIKAIIYPENENSIMLARKTGFVFSDEYADEVFRGRVYPHQIYILDVS